MSQPLKDAETSTFIIPANTQKSFDFSGRFVRCLSSDNTLEISFNNGAKAEFEAGLSRRIPDDSAEFTSFQLFNNTGAPITAVIGWGYGDIEDSRLSVTGQISVKNTAENALHNYVSDTHAYGQITVGAVATQVLTGRDERMIAVVKNNGSVSMWVGKNGSVSPSDGFEIAPGETFQHNCKTKLMAIVAGGTTAKASYVDESFTA